MNNVMSVLLVDDHPMIRKGLAAQIRHDLPGAAVHECGTVESARTLLTDETVTHLILDISLPDGDGLDLAAEMQRIYGRIRVFIMSMHSGSGMIELARSAGCAGFFHKGGDVKHLIRALASDSPDFVLPSDLENRRTGSGEDDLLTVYAGLTRREKEVLRPLATGLGYKEVAYRLEISHRTAAVHRYNIYRKLGFRNDVEMAHFAGEIGLTV